MASNTLAMLGLGQDPAQPNPLRSLLGSDGFGNTLQALGASLMSGPRNAPLQDFGGNLQGFQKTTMQQRAFEQEQAMAEEEKARRAELAQYVQTVVPENLQSLAQADPESALRIWESMKPSAPSYGWEVINGQLVRTDSAGGATPMGQFGNQPRPMSTEERQAWGIPATDTTAYFLDEDGTPKALGGSGVTVNNHLGGDKFADALGGELGKQQATLIEAGRNATSNNIRLNQLEQHLQNAPQGAQGAVAQFASGLGLAIPGADDIQAAQALINQMVPNQRPPGSGPMSDADLDLYKKSLPTILNQPGGNAYIIQTAMAINEYTIQQSRIAEAIANGEISRAEGMEMQRSIPNPLADFNAGAAAPRSGPTLPPGVTIREIQ